MAAKTRYTTVSAWFHWISATLIFVQLYTGFTFHDMDRGPARTDMFEWHKLIGVTILVLAIARLLHRLTVPPPALPDAMPGWQKLAARASHFLLYAAMIFIPYTGVANVAGRAEGGMIDLKFGIPFPALPGDTPLGNLGESHETLVKLLIALMIVHVAAGLYHQFGPKRIGAGRMPPFKS